MFKFLCLIPMRCSLIFLFILLSVASTSFGQMLTANFTYTMGSAGTVSFTSTSTNTISSTIHKWYFGDGSSSFSLQSVVHTYTANGHFAVLLVLESPNGVILDSTTKALNIAGLVTGLNSVKENIPEIHAAYNPVTNCIDLSFGSPAQPASIVYLFSADGRTLRLQTAVSGSSLDCEGLADGIYYVRESSADRCKKVLIIRL